MVRRLSATLIILLLPLLAAPTVLSEGMESEEFYPWSHHTPPFDFKFGAMIDSHQQSRINSAGILQGFIYIQRTGSFTADAYPIAEKAHCSTGTCSLGWVIKGVPVSAKLVHVAPRVWLVDPAELPAEPGYTHFQWIGPPKTPHELIVGNTYQGYLLKRIAPEPFYWLGGSSGGSGGGGSGGGGCGGDTGGCGGDTGGCGGDTGGCSGDTGGCGGDTGGDTGGCGGDTGGDTGGCGGDTGGDTGGCGGDTGGDTGGCGGDTGGDTGGCSGDTGGCGGHDGGETGGSSGHAGGSDGRLVPEGVDTHSNIVTVWDGTWTGGCGGHGSGETGGCDGHDGGTCEGH